MDLRELARSKFAPTGRSLLNSKATRQVYPLVGSEAHTEPLLAMFFWQILRSSTVFAHALRLGHASPLAQQQSESIVVAHGPDDNPRYDLVVLDPGYEQDEPTAVHLEDLDPADLQGGWERWQATRISQLRDAAFAGYNRAAEDFQRSLRLVSALDQSFAMEAMSLKQFGIIVARQPLFAMNSGIPSPCWAVTVPPGTTPVSTVGAVVSDIKGRTGVTVALHSLQNVLPTVVPGTTTVEVVAGGSRFSGIVQSVDAITDSAFVEFPQPFGSSIRRTQGPLRGVSPRVNEKATFEGLSSGSAVATVTGASADLPLVLPYSQLKVFTTPVTSPGDSGAALVDSDGHILGFSFYRTAIGQPIEFSAWIWADSVYAAHNLV